MIEDGKLLYSKNFGFNEFNETKNFRHINKQNIYITSDEPIKEGDYGLIGKDIGKIIISGDGYEFLLGVAISYEYDDFYYLQQVCKKIVLTTDQDLIKDGVQEIPEYFLIHYIIGNNPIEYVEIKEHLESIDTMKINYELIIPKEEPKQEFPQFGTKEFYTFFSDLCDKLLGGKPSTKLHKGEVVDESYPKEFKQETTLEEVRKVERSDLYNKIHSIVKQIPREDVETDAMDASSCAYDIEQLFYKWQMERSYSEEEVINLLYIRSMCQEHYESDAEVREWFEKFKKK